MTVDYLLRAGPGAPMTSGRVGASGRGPGRSLLVLAVALVGTVLVRSLYLPQSLSSDEGGFLMVARQWGPGGHSLYGNQWVDRPPLLIAIFRSANALGGLVGDTVAVHLVAIVFALGGVVAAWFAGRVIGGPRAAGWSCVCAAALLSSVQLGGERLTGEGIAAPLVLVSVAMTLTAMLRSHRRVPDLALLFGAGLVAGCAVLVKQNFVDAVVFAAVLMLWNRRPPLLRVIAGAAGVAVPMALTVVWATWSGPGLGALWRAVYVFRGRALTVILSHSMRAPVSRLHLLVVCFVLSGAAVLAVATLWTCWRSRRDGLALRAAIVITLAYEVASVALGASWWQHYLMQLVPMLVLGVALLASRPLPGAARLLVGYVVVASVLFTSMGAPVLFGSGRPSSTVAVGRWVRAHAHAGDTAFVAYGNGQVLQSSGLTSPYPYSWSLPVRVNDPHLTLLTATLAGPRAPTWVVRAMPFNAWQIRTPALRRVIATRYHRVASVCGHQVYLLDTAPRWIGPTATCNDPG